MLLWSGLVLSYIVTSARVVVSSSEPIQRRLQQSGNGIFAGLGQKLTNSVSNVRPIDFKGNVLDAANRIVDELATNGEGLLPNSDLATLASQFFSTVAYIRDGVPVSANLPFSGLSLGPPADDRTRTSTSPPSPPQSAWGLAVADLSTPSSLPPVTQSPHTTLSFWPFIDDPDQKTTTAKIRLNSSQPPEAGSTSGQIISNKEIDAFPSTNRPVDDDEYSSSEYPIFSALSLSTDPTIHAGAATQEGTPTDTPVTTMSSVSLSRASAGATTSNGRALITQTLRGTSSVDADQTKSSNIGVDTIDAAGAAVSASGSSESSRRLGTAESQATVIVIPAGNILAQFSSIPNQVPNNGVPPMADGSKSKTTLISTEEHKVAADIKPVIDIQRLDAYGIPPPSVATDETTDSLLSNLRGWLTT